MNTYVALLRAVNVGGTGRLPMEALRTACRDAGLNAVKTYIASGNVVFCSDKPFQTVSNLLHDVTAQLVGKPIDIFFRSVDEMASIVESNPFRQAPANQVLVNFFTDAVTPALIDGIRHRTTEQIQVRGREVFVWYPHGMGQSKMRWSSDVVTTGRNLRTVCKLVDMAKSIGQEH